MKTLLGLLRRSEVDVTKSMVFLDAAYVLPTASGMPLELTANGSATVGLQVKGRLDLSEMMTKKAVLVEGRVAPSAAVQVVATMGVNAYVTRAGLRTVSTLHSSTYIDGKVGLGRSEQLFGIIFSTLLTRILTCRSMSAAAG